MGFIPIFITLGGFVFLFVMLVNHNLNQKKKSYYAKRTELNEVLGAINSSGSFTNELDLAQMERAYLDLKATAIDSTSLQRVKGLVVDMRRIKFQYQNLKDTKPYYYVGKLFGHSDI